MLFSEPGPIKTLPFFIDNACAGLAHCHGLIRDEGKELVIEYQTQDAIAGIIKSDVREARIPVSEIAGISLLKSWFGFSTRLVIQLVSMKHASGLPGMKQGRFELPISRRDRKTAEGLVASVSSYLSKSAGALVIKE